jgi:hypothetical protein
MGDEGMVSWIWIVIAALGGAAFAYLACVVAMRRALRPREIKAEADWPPPIDLGDAPLIIQGVRWERGSEPPPGYILPEELQ